ncbi:hypothetical protein [Ferruginibacter sp.]|nr:hypothetical protein [Ferruginibacter sp.]
MNTTVKQRPEFLAYWCITIVVLIVLGGYGRQAIAWLLMKLYEFFIQKDYGGM